VSEYFLFEIRLDCHASSWQLQCPGSGLKVIRGAIARYEQFNVAYVIGEVCELGGYSPWQKTKKSQLIIDEISLT
jgi:hypothetical protein